MADSRKKGVSFSFSKKVSTKNKSEKNALNSDDAKAKKEETDYINAAEGKELKSIKPEEKPKEKVIPCKTKNRWILSEDAKFVDSLDRQAAEELLKAVSGDDTEGNENENVSIPLLMRNPLPDIEGYEKNEKLDIALRPEQSSMQDYEDMPVSSFGAAMLRGMGWKKGEAIGGTNKGFTEPIEYIPRSKGLGLGAERRVMDDMILGKKRKPGDSITEKSSGAIKEKDGRVRHFKGVGEALPQESSLDYRPGVGVIIEKGPHQDMCGKIVAVDVDTSRITIQFHLSEENITLHQCNARLLDDIEYRALSKQDKLKQNGHKIRSNKRTRNDEQESQKCKDSKYSKKSKEGKSNSSSQKGSNTQTKCWLYPQIKVRIISKNYEKGKYYNKKVKVVDVVSRDKCVCQTEEGRLIEDVPQSALETVVPKTLDSHVRVVGGDSKGQLALLLERNTTKYSAVIQLLMDKSIITADYDDICEHVGDGNEF
ncbi:unnamed protein product [Pocillopora meandrina]|uniref:G-patch domain-containing protein n=1 Tax=Pocillopora meandrina TaxID=46732 RepID=A0AAU9XIW6_9CNID|nr:unnamed protein product [Pocillopora meandrina]